MEPRLGVCMPESTGTVDMTRKRDDEVFFVTEIDSVGVVVDGVGGQ